MRIKINPEALEYFTLCKVEILDREKMHSSNMKNTERLCKIIALVSHGNADDKGDTQGRSFLLDKLPVIYV